MLIRTKTRALVETRIKAGFGQRELARSLGISSGYMSQIEAGERNPSPALAKRMCEKLDVSFEALFELEFGDEQAAAREVV